MDVSYELYKVFYRVAKSLSFSEAAAELYISQSAVSQSIKLLEKRLGQVLFVRNTKRVALTPEGELLLKHIEPAIQLITQGENQLTRDSVHGGKQLRIAASDTICRYFLVPYFNELHRRFPQVHISIINGTSLRCAELLASGQADFAVVNSPNPALAGNPEIRKLREFHDIFVGNPAYFPDCFKSKRENAPKVLSLKELMNYPILMLSKRSTTSTFLHEQFQKHSLDLAPSIEISSNDLLLDLAKIGLGIACVPDFCVPEDSEDLRRLSIKETLAARKLLLAYDNKLPLSEAGKCFLELLSATAYIPSKE